MVSHDCECCTNCGAVGAALDFEVASELVARGRHHGPVFITIRGLQAHPDRRGRLPHKLSHARLTHAPQFA